jgi:FkbM family methyltransferase
MIKYKLRKLFFTIFCYTIRLIFLITGKKRKDFNYHKAYFRFLKVFKRKFSYKVGDSILTYDPVFSGIGWPIYFSGSFEDEELSICAKFIHPDSIIADVGANIGLHSIYYANIAINGLIYSFEPSRYTYSYLMSNLKNKNNIIPINIGLSDTNGIFSFFDCENDALSGLKDTLRSAIREETKILCLKGDDFFDTLQLQKLDFIKIDVEGLEQEVIEGMSQTIEKFHPVIFCEIYKGVNSNSHPEKTVSFITGMGYKAFVVSNSLLKPFISHIDSEHNYFFLPVSKYADNKLDFLEPNKL